MEDPTEHDHDRFIGSDGWWACHYPEQPHDNACHYRVGCRACGLAFVTAARHMPDLTLWLTGPDLDNVRITNWVDGIKIWNEVTQRLFAGSGALPPDSLPGPQLCNMENAIAVPNRQIGLTTVTQPSWDLYR
jgi:hypothetical protein